MIAFSLSTLRKAPDQAEVEKFFEAYLVQCQWAIPSRCPPQETDSELERGRWLLFVSLAPVKLFSGSDSHHVTFISLNHVDTVSALFQYDVEMGLVVLALRGKRQ